ncbi:ctenidin-1-like [Plodia interpunctella]|uniref:ctenidin-1-like n=1 Tax=Plodia interpunctella TaxID=58824 RepID=UPI0023675568|nr:ctenidin-1-like [Plodia interpunctella]
MDFFNKGAICILLTIFVSIAVIVDANSNEENLPVKTETLKPAANVGNLRTNTNEGKSRVKRQFGGYYDPYYGRRRIYPYPPIIFGGIGLGGFGGYGYGRGFGGRGFGGRGVGGRGFGGRGIGGRGFGGRGIGGRGIGGRGGGVGGGRGGGRG